MSRFLLTRHLWSCPLGHAAAERSLPVVGTGVSHMPDLGFIVLVIAVFVLIGLIAKGVNRL
ncbi:hypothetical protein [Streptomyces shenzhenensis]|uniref:hypothetical protein n=1 Tax=Streptomyces shenzhenensis TaxID=943815 RepID=UPI0011C3D96F|nr:hypothetical protein [Streptomyces shenzhenensis]